MNDSAILTILQIPDGYRFYFESPTHRNGSGLRTNQSPTMLVDQRAVDTGKRYELKEAIDRAVELFRNYRRARGDNISLQQGAIAQHPLTALGKLIYNLLLPKSIQQEILHLNSAISLILSTDDSEIPWELMHDEETFLALKRSLGRKMHLHVPVPNITPTTNKVRSYLILANPTPDTHNLPHAATEGKKLLGMFDDALQDISAELLGGSQVTRMAVLQSLADGNHALIHYSGHAEPEALLLDRGKLHATEIRDALRGHPFVFLNACRSGEQVATTSELFNRDLSECNLAAAFLQGGAIGFVGTLWPVSDYSSPDFAEWFYALILDGESVGEALRQTRQQMIDTYPDDPLWASYVFYGDPNLQLIQRPSQSKRSGTILTVRRTVNKDSRWYGDLVQAANWESSISEQIASIAQCYGGVLYTAFHDTWQIGFGLTKTHKTDSTHAAAHIARKILLVLQSMQQEHNRGLHQPFTAKVGISQGEFTLHSIQTTSGQVEQVIGAPVERSLTLANKAVAGEIWIDEAMRQSVERTYECDLLSDFELDIGSLPIFRLGNERRITSTTPLIGREDELAQLSKWWHKAMAGDGRVVGLTGEAGIGKSHLIQAFQKIVKPQVETSNILLHPSMRWIEVACLSRDQGVSLSLLAQLIRALAQIERMDDVEAQQAKLANLIDPHAHNHEISRQQEKIALLGRVLGLPSDTNSLDKRDPTQQQKQLAKLLLDLLRQQSSQQPLLLVLEDLHCADDASLAILPLILNQLAKVYIIVLASYRLDWNHGWEQWSHYERLLLSELDSEACKRLLETLLPGGYVGSSLTEPILKLTHGNPFYLEGVIKNLREQGILSLVGEQWVLSQTVDGNLIPSTVQDVLLARLDTLDASHRMVLEKAAVVGEEFEYLVLKAIEDAVRREQLGDILDELEDRGFITSGEGFRPEINYFFRHSLLQQVVYFNIDENVRRPRHRLVAKGLINMVDKNELNNDVERIADHYQKSDDRIQAIVFGLRAAEHAQRYWNQSAALNRYDTVLASLENLTSNPLNEIERNHGVDPAQYNLWKLSAYIGKGDLLCRQGHNDEAIRLYESAFDLAKAMDNPLACKADLYYKIGKALQAKGDFVTAQAKLTDGLHLVGAQRSVEAGRLYVWSGFLHWNQSHLQEALTACMTGIAILEQTEGGQALAQAYNLRGLVWHDLGQPQNAAISFAQSIALYQEVDDRLGLMRAFNNRAVTYQDDGHWGKALHDLEHAFKLAETTDEIWWQAGALINKAEIYRRQGELAPAFAANQQALQIGQEHELLEIVGLATMNLGVCHLKHGDLPQTEEMLDAAIELFTEQKSEHLAEAQGHLAELRIEQNQPARALQLVQEALQQSEEIIQIGRLHLIMGRAYRQLQRLDEARENLEQSIVAFQTRNFRYELALTWLELALLIQAMAQTTEDMDGQLHQQAIQYCDQAVTIFRELGAKLDLSRAEKIRESL